MGASIGSASLRYRKFPTKDIDVLSVQAGYQFFIRASGLTADGRDIPVGKNNGKDAPIQNLTTIDTLAIGVQDNRNFLPTYRKQTVELITPQVTFNSQNHSLLSDKNQNICEAWFPDFRKNGFCYYADFSLTVGQTFADVVSQQNANVAFSATVGQRFDKTDWKLALQSTVTEKAYEDVVGGRNDVLFQIGPVLSYGSPYATGTPIGTGHGRSLFPLPIIKIFDGREGRMARVYSYADADNCSCSPVSRFASL